MQRADFRFFGSVSAALLLAGLASCQAEVGDDPSGSYGNGTTAVPAM